MSKSVNVYVKSTFLEQEHFIQAIYAPHGLSISIQMDRNP